MKKNTKARIYNRISNAKNILREGRNREMIDSFLEKYFQCELVCVEMIKDYRTDKKDDDKDIKIIVQTIKSAMNHIGIHVDDLLLNNLFSSNKKSGQRSAKKLRDGIVHELSKEAIREVINRYYELNTYMDEFLLLFDIQ